MSLSDPNPCFGREEDLERLSSRIYADQPRQSATLICGDSGIGKTRLMAALRVRLNEPSIFCGYAEAYPGDRHDPLARALDDLLKRHVYRLDRWGARIRTAVATSKHLLRDVDKLSQFCSAAGGYIFNQSLLVGISRVLTPALGGSILAGAKTLAAGLLGIGRPPTAELAVKPPVEVIEDVLRILRCAFPEYRMVLVLDNLSADAESLATGPNRFRNLDSLTSYLSGSMRRLENVHVVATWKLNPQTMESLQKLSSVLYEHGGHVEELGPVSDSAIADWLQDRFPWFRSLEQTQRTEVVQMTRGLPQVVSWWDERTGDSVSLDQLRLYARDAADRKFVWLRNEALSDKNRSLLYQLVVLPSLPPEDSVAALTGTAPGELHDYLARWKRNRLFAPDGEGLRFSHESKRDAVRAALESEEGLVRQDRERAANGLYSALIENAHGRSKLHTKAHEYLGLAFEIRGLAGLPQRKRKAMERTLEILQSPAPSLSPGDLEVIQEAPAGLRAICYDRAAWGYEAWAACAPVLDLQVQRDIEELQNQPEQKLWRMDSVLRWHARAGDHPFCEQLLGQMRRVLDENGRPHYGEEAFAFSLSTVLAICGNRHDLPGVEAALDELRKMRSRSLDCEVIRMACAHATTNRLNAYERTGKLDAKEIERSVEEIREICSLPLEREVDAEQLVRALYHLTRKGIRRGENLAESRAILARWPANPDVGVDFIRIAGLNALRALSGGEPIEALVCEILEAGGSHGEAGEVALQKARAMSAIASVSRLRERFQDADLAVESAHRIYEKHPAEDVANQVADAILKNSFKEQFGLAAQAARCKQVEELQLRFPASVDLGRSLATARMIVVMGLLKRLDHTESQAAIGFGPYETWLNSLRGELANLRLLRESLPGDLEIADTSAHVCHFAGWALLAKSHAAAIPELVEEATQICDRWPGRAEFARAAILGWSVESLTACVAQRDVELAFARLQNAADVAERMPEDPTVAQTFAGCLAGVGKAALNQDMPQLAKRCREDARFSRILSRRSGQ